MTLKRKNSMPWTLKSSLYLDLFKNDNGNCHFFSNLRFLRFLHNFFSSKGREKCQAAFSALFWHLDQISWELIISSFFFFIWTSQWCTHNVFTLRYLKKKIKIHFFIFTRGKSLLELWVTTFLKLRVHVSNSMPSAHMILK